MTTLVAVARTLPDPLQALLRPAYRWMRRAKHKQRKGKHRADGRASWLGERFVVGRHKVPTLDDELRTLDPWLLAHLERND